MTGPVAVVLAGGASRRFGTDKLAADVVGGVSLLDTVLAGLPAEVEIVVVGPPRPVSRTVRFVREEPPGGGPAAALITGVRAALATSTPIVWVLPGDAPAAGSAATELDQLLARREEVDAVVAVDADDRLQPLQLALRRAAAEQLLRRAGPSEGRGVSARSLVGALEPPAVRHRLSANACFDIDTPEQLRDYRRRHAVGGGCLDLRNAERA